MHKQVSALLSAGGSPGKLALFGLALGAADLDIDTIGGAEWLHDGPLTFILKDDGDDAMALRRGLLTITMCRGSSVRDRRRRNE